MSRLTCPWDAGPPPPDAGLPPDTGIDAPLPIDAGRPDAGRPRDAGLDGGLDGSVREHRVADCTCCAGRARGGTAPLVLSALLFVARVVAVRRGPRAARSEPIVRGGASSP